MIDCLIKQLITLPILCRKI